MNTSHLTRREFLNLLGAASLAWISTSCKPDLDNFTTLETQSSLSQPNLPNILVIVFDAWSAADTSLYGYHRQTTPVLEKLANQALVYHHHYASGNFTSPGTASLLTGLYPWTHRSLKQRAQVQEQYSSHNIFRFLPDTYHRFAYTHNIFTYILLNQFRQHINHLIKPGKLAIQKQSLAEKWFDNDFLLANEVEKLLLKSEYTPPISLFLSLLDHAQLHQQYDDLVQSYQNQYPRGLVHWVYDASLYTYRLEDSIDWIISQTQSAPRPYFGYVHLLPPHSPYNPPSEFCELFNDNWKPPEKPVFDASQASEPGFLLTQRQHYDQYIAYVDAEFGRLYNSLQVNGSLENTILILTSDHGELFERGIHGHITPALFEPLIHIPLLIFLPGQRSRVDIHAPTNAIDLLPTLVRLAGATPPSSCEGIQLPFDSQQFSSNRNSFVVEAKETHHLNPAQKASIAMIQWPYKYIYYTGYENIKNGGQIFDLSTDPDEINDLYSQNLPLSQMMQETLLSRIPASFFSKSKYQ